MRVVSVNYNFNNSFSGRKSSVRNTSIPEPFQSKKQTNFDTLNKLKEETKVFPRDIEYRKNLLKNSGMNPEEYYKLRSIIGHDEIISLMKSYNKNENFYKVGEDDKNVKSGFMRGNLHIHTQASDGKLTVEELLNQAVEYADKVAKSRPEFNKAPFTIAITDHDTTESAKKAIKIIAENPIKYQNLRVILGSEITTYNFIEENINAEPTNVHVLTYGIDPNEKGFKNFIDGTKLKKNELEIRMIDDANKVGKNIYTVQEAKGFSNFLEKNLVGICKYVESYLQTKYVLSEIVCKNEEIKELLKKRNLPSNPQELIKKLDVYLEENYGRNRSVDPLEEFPKFVQDEKTKEILLNEYQKPEHQEYLKKLKESNSQYYSRYDHSEKFGVMPDFKDLYNGLKNQDGAIIGLAHPLKTIWKTTNIDENINFLKRFYSQFKSACKEKAKFSEVYYQSYVHKFEKPIYDFLKNISKKLNLFKTGSYDTHGLNIFRRF